MNWLRVLTLVVLVMNLGVGSWWLWRPPPPAPVEPSRNEPGIPGLRLLGEGDESHAVEAMPPALRSAGLAGVCHELGPFHTQIDLRRAMHVLTPQALRIQFRETRSVIRRAWRVYLPSPGTREAALSLARQLSARGMTDYYVVTTGEEENTVSLGVYRDRGRAESRLAEVRAGGFAAEIIPRNDEVPQFWIDIEVAEGSAWGLPAGAFRDAKASPIPCDAESIDVMPAVDDEPVDPSNETAEEEAP